MKRILGDLFSWLYRNSFLLALILFCLFPIRSSNAEDVEIGRNIRDAKSKVVRLTVPAEYDDKEVSLQFVTEKDGDMWLAKRGNSLWSREGIHAYEMRDVEGWKGLIPLVMLGLNGGMKISGEIASPSLGDELDIFFTPQQVLPRTVHLLEPHTLFGISWNVWVLIIFILAAISLAFLFGKTVALALFVAFWIAWGFVDLRAMCDHIGIMRKTQKKGYWISDGFLSIQTSLQKYSDAMSNDAWTRDKSWDEESPVLRPFLNYILAEKKFVPYKNKINADLLFTVKNDEFKGIRLKS